MAEPTNTPLPTAPGTPIPGTPRSASPAPGYSEINPSATGGIARGPSSLTVPIPVHISATTLSSTTSPLALSSESASAETVPGLVVPPVPPAANNNNTTSDGADGSSGGSKKPRVLHIGDPIRYNPETWADFAARFDVVRPEAAERERAEFVRALRERRWGDFHAIYRPFWGSGGEMGHWDAELVDLLPDSVRVFASAGAGFDWADVKVLGERGIIYCNSGLAAAEAVADFAVAMIISTFRALPYCIASATSTTSPSTPSTTPPPPTPSPSTFRACHALATAQSHNLRGHALGIVGLGNIGQRIARRMRAAFGMEVLYYDVERKPSSLESELGAAYRDSLARLVRESDCVVLCAPSPAPDSAPGSAPSTIISRESLADFRPGARLVNVARGSLVDEDALADALDAGRVSAVALDVHAAEPRVHPRLAAHAGARALLTCHNAGGTVETHAGFEELGMRNIMAVLGGREAITPVNLRFLRKKGGQEAVTAAV
ncbi:hypothetical protein SLS62_000856 [Diatrype stigma]|uniref:D-mandelate dehydrogenase n=1 Tax=Diatrype stigma TaxID=117547 RepID=A0AAN9V181_9PEZI